jgi:hypothetical protein
MLGTSQITYINIIALFLDVVVQFISPEELPHVHPRMDKEDPSGPIHSFEA